MLGTMDKKPHEQLVAESNARLDRLIAHTMWMLAEKIPEDAPTDLVLTLEMQVSGIPWWIGPDVNDAHFKLAIDNGHYAQSTH